MEYLMNRERKTPLDVMDDLYTLAYWMTGNGMNASELVNCTYLNAEGDGSALELFRMFRACYFETSGLSVPEGHPAEPESVSLRKRFADMKLSVLLSEICGFTYRDIAEITGMSVETLRIRLSWGRKLLFKAFMLMPPAEKRVLLTGGSLS